MIFRSFVICLSFAFILGGCKAKHGAAIHESNTAVSATQPKILRFGNASEPQYIDPTLQVGQVEFAITRAVMEGLVSEGPGDDETVPGAAERWEISSDGLTYTFHLQPNGKWSDGTPVTTADFLGAYQRMLTPAVAADYVYMLFLVKGAEDYYDGKIKDFAQTGFQALDDHTLQLTLRRPAPFLLDELKHTAWFPVPVAVLRKFGDLDRRDAVWTRVENFIGNGPFRLRQWLPNQKLTVERAPTYWDHKHVKLDQIEFYPVESGDTEERMFRTGQLDITYSVPMSKLADYKRKSPQLVESGPWCANYFYRFNVERKPLNDVRVRRALALAIDRESLVKNVNMNGDIPAYSIVPPNTAGYVSHYHLEGTVEEARRLLAAAGFPGGKGFPQLTFLYNTFEKHQAIAEAIQEMWRRNLGIEIKLSNEEWKVFESDEKAINFDLSRGGWLADYYDPNVFLETWKTNAGNNFTHWGDPEYDRLLDSSLNVKTNEERYAIYNRMEKILEDQVPIIPLYFYMQSRLVNPQVKNFRIKPLDNYPWKNVDLER